MLTMTATQECPLSFEVHDAKGNPAAVDGVPVWSTADDTHVAVDAAPDGMTATIRAVGPATTSPVQISVTADADLGAGVRPLVGLLDVSIMAGEATVIAITPGTPVDQAPATASTKKGK
jgi:hypothetical protein